MKDYGTHEEDYDEYTDYGYQRPCPFFEPKFLALLAGILAIAGLITALSYAVD